MDIVDYSEEECREEGLWAQEATDASGQVHQIIVRGRGPFELPIGGPQFHSYEVEVDENMNIPQGRTWTRQQDAFAAGREYLESVDAP